MVPIIGFCGASNSGKTTLVEKVVGILVQRGYRVGAIKHHGHDGPVADDAAAAGKDSARLAAAGAGRVALAHAGGLSLNIAANDWTPAEIASRLMYDMDLVIVEGFKKADLPKIEVVAPGKEPLMPSGGSIVAVACRQAMEAPGEIPVLDAGDAEAVAEFVLQKALAAPRAELGAARVRVGGRELAVNGFSQRVIINTVRGLLASFKGGDAPGGIEVEIGPRGFSTD